MAFFEGGGVCGGLVRSLDWSKTSLGPIASWPVSLKAMVGTLLHARHPMFLFWGPDLIQFYNDAYLPTLGADRHPSAMGQHGRECWGEIWSIIGPEIDDVMSHGKSSWHEDALVPTLRNGKLEDIYWSYAHSPVFDDDGRIGGTLVVCTETTSRVVAERARHAVLVGEGALRQSEARFRALIEKSTEAISLTAADGATFYRSPATGRMLGWTPEEMMGRGSIENIFHEDRASFAAAVESLVQTGVRELQLQFRAVHRDGSVRWMEGTATNLLGDPDVRAIVGHFRDVTARRHSEELAATALAAAHAAAVDHERLVASLDYERRRLGMLLANAPAFIAVLRGPTHVFEMVNDAYLQVVGRRDLIGKALIEGMPELAGQGFVELLDQVLATGEPFVANNMPVLLTRRGGSVPEQRYVNFVYQPLVEADGTRSGIFVHGVDVTATAIVQQRVRAQFHGVPVPTYVWQRIEREGAKQFVLVDFNQAALTLDGEINGHLGETAAVYFRDSPDVLDDLVRCLDERTTIQHEARRTIVPGGQPRTLFVTYASAPPNLVLVHTEDITARVELEEQLRQSQKMDAVGRLAGGIAHDFNNLLSVILSYAGLAIEALQPGDPLREDIQQIQIAGDRATDLTRQLLTFSRQQVLQPRVLDPQQIVAAMVSMLRRLLGEDIELSIRSHAETGRVFADPGQIEQVVMNLAVNARDAMPNGGMLTIELSNVALDETYPDTHLGITPGDYVMIATSDNGIGMDAPTVARIFEPFFTTKPQGHGTGLGLSTVFGIVEQAHGHIRVYSELGHGTTFKVYLPRTDRAADVVARADPASLALRGSETILLVEDEEQVRVVGAAILRRSGYEVLEASNAGEAFLISRDRAGHVDLLLTDVVMPRMGGRKLAEQLALERPDMKVLFASGYTDDAVIHHGVLDAGVAFLQKPFTSDVLLRKVREVLDASDGRVR